jgi:MFS family permease
MPDRNRISLTLAVAQGVSTLGSQISVLALPTLAVTELSAGPVGFSAIAIAEVVPVLVLTGTIGRFVGARAPLGTMVGADAVRAALISLVPLAMLLDIAGLWLVLAVAGAAGLFTAAFDVSAQSYVALSAEDAERAGMNGAIASGHSIGQLVGPAAGGVLIAVLGPSTAMLVDAATFVVSALVLATLPRQPASTSASTSSAARTGTPTKWTERRRSPLAAFAPLRGNREILRLSLAGAALNLGGSGLGAIFILYAYTTLDISSVAVGFLFAVYGGASLLGGMLSGRIVRRLGCHVPTRVAGSVAAVSLLLIPAASWGSPVAVLAVYEVLFGFSATLWSVSFTTLRQNTTRLNELSQLNAAVRSILVCTFPVGALAAGVIAGVYGLHAATGVLAGVAVLSCGWYVRPGTGARAGEADLEVAR